MFTQRNFINLSLIFLFPIVTILFCQIQQPEKPLSPIRIQSMDDGRLHELHQYLIINKSIFDKHEILMVHPEYYIYLRAIINKMDEIIDLNSEQPVINKKILADIGLIYEDLHFVDYLQLKTQIQNKIIQNKINFLLNK